MATEQNYVIIRDIGRGALGDPFRPGMLESLGPASGAELAVEEESLRHTDVADLNRDPQVVGAAPNMPVRVIRPATSTDATASAEGEFTWGVRAVGADDTPYTGAGVTVAILDTGIDADHAAFHGVDVVQRDFTGEGDGDVNGHGTHCAGTVFGQVTSGTRFGVAPGVDKALIGKVLGAQGGGSTKGIYDGLLWASSEGANIVSMSLGFDFPGLVQRLVQQYDLEIPQATTMALEGYRTNIALFEKLAGLLRAQAGLVGPGVVIIAAAGNESQRDAVKPYEIAVAPPAAADGIVSVGALASNGAHDSGLTIADFSNTGPNVSGPGVQIYSAWPGGGFRYLSGTSMATPHVAGVAALWAQKLLEDTGAIRPEQLKARIIGQAHRSYLAASVDMTDVGVGLVRCPIS